MALEKLSKFGGFDALNGDVHRQPASLIGHPTLARHLGFAEVLSRSPKARSDSVKDYLNKLRQRLEQANCAFPPKQFEKPLDDEGRGRVVRLSFIWREVFVSLRIEIHTENIALSVFLDLSLNRRGTPETDGLAEAIDASLFKYSQRVRSGNKSLRTFRRRFYHSIWKLLFSDIVDAEGILGSHLGQVFCDFRGFISGDASNQGQDGRQARQFINPPFELSNHLRGPEPDYSDRDQDWARRIVQSTWPLLCDADSDVELTVSRFLDGRAVYISALGDPHAPAYRERWNPVIYYLHFSNGDAFQIGRLVDRIHYLGMMRLAALFQINDLQTLARALDEIEPEIAKITPSISKVISDLENSTQSRAMSEAAYQEVIGNLTALIQRSGSIVQAENIRLSARVDRSMYYIGRFKKDIEALRICRLEGYQPYDEFVFRRLGGSFLFIEMISARLSQHFRNIQTLSGYVTALSVARSTQETRRLEAQNLTIAARISQNTQETKELADSNLNLAQEMRDLNTEIDDIQDVGEIVLFTVIAPHYFTESITGIAREAMSETAKTSFNAWALFIAVTVGVAIVITRLVLGVCRKYREHHSKHKSLDQTPPQTTATRRRFLERTFFIWWRSKDTPRAERLAFLLKSISVAFVWLIAATSLVWVQQRVSRPTSRPPANSASAFRKEDGTEKPQGTILKAAKPPQPPNSPRQSQATQGKTDVRQKTLSPPPLRLQENPTDRKQ